MTPFCTRDVAFGEVAWLEGRGSDERVPDGIHWHVTMGAHGGLPAGPTIVVDVTSGETTSVSLFPQVADPSDLRVTPDRPIDFLVASSTARGSVTGWLNLDCSDDSRLTMAVVDPTLAPNGAPSVQAAYSDPRTPWHRALATADPQIVRVSGEGVVSEYTALAQHWLIDGAPERILDRASLAAECARELPEYLRATWEEHWEDRVALSAPVLRLPSDSERPDEAEPDPDREIRRIRALIDPPPETGETGVAAWARLAYGALSTGALASVDGSSGAGLEGAAVTQRADSSYLQAGVDPGIARWQGLSGTLGDRPSSPVTGLGDGAGMLVAFVPVYRLEAAGAAGSAAARRTNFDGFYDQELGGQYEEALQRVADFPELPDGSRWTLELLAVPMPYLVEEPQDVPEAPILSPAASPVSPGGTSWNASTIDRWTGVVGITGMWPRGLVAFTQLSPEPGTFHPGVPGCPAPMLAGTSLRHNAPVLATDALSGDAATVEVAVRVGDWVGRWGAAGTTTLLRPPRPAPPTPQLRTRLLASPPAAGDARSSSGTVRVDVLAAGASAPGSLPVREIVVQLPDGLPPRHLDVSAQGRAASIPLVVEFAATGTQPGESVTAPVSAHAVDTAGAVSASVTVSLRIVDPRPIRAPRAGARLIATTRRGNSPTVTAALEIDAAPHARAYRVLIAGEAGLRRADALGLGVADPAQSRVARAAALRAAMASRDRRRFYSWATPFSFPVVNGKAVATIELPAGTDGVVFVRAVAVAGTVDPGAPAGSGVTETVSTPFEATTAAAVVVPLSDYPPTPELQLTEGADGLVTATVRVHRPTRRILDRLSPTGIQARIVHVLQPEGDPEFWPPIATVRLVPRADDPTVHEASVTLRSAPWTRTALAVSVRYPEESTVDGPEQPGEIRSAGAGASADAIPSPWGPFSVPAWIDVHGAEPEVVFTEDGVGGLVVTVLPPAAGWTVQLFTESEVGGAPGPLRASGAPVAAGGGLVLPPAGPPPATRPGASVVLRDSFGTDRAPVPVPLSELPPLPPLP